MKCEIGDTITYKTIANRIRTVVITDFDEKNGSPIFDGDMADGSMVWGYEEE